MARRVSVETTSGRLDPIIEGLIVRLPPANSVWPAADQQAWLDLMKSSFGIVYRETDTAEGG